MAEVRIKSKEDMLAFMFAGSASFTIKSHKTQVHFNYRIKKSRNDHTLFYVYGGKSNDIIGRIRTGKENTFTFFPNKAPYAPEKYILPFHWFVNHFGDKQVEFFHIGKCGRCGRTLTDPESIKRGIGPECVKIVGVINKELKEDYLNWGV